MSLVNKNILANILGRGWSMFSVFIFIPLYISVLGDKMYGVVGFYAILQGILIFTDAGLTATLRRELAKGSEKTQSRHDKFKIFRSIEFVYFIIVSFIIISVFFFADFIVQNWLNIEDLDSIQTKNGIQIMGAALGLNFLSRLYQGGLLGLEKQVLSNVLQITWGALKNGGVILALIFIDKNLIVFFSWQMGINILYVVILRFVLIRSLKKRNTFSWYIKEDLKMLKTIWKYATGMLIISVIAAINSQFDKLIVSNSFTVSELTVYTVAYSLAMIPVILSGPIAMAIFPRLVKYYDNKQEEMFKTVFNNSFVLIVLLAGSAGVLLVLYAEFFILIWTQKKDIAAAAAFPAGLLLIGQVFLAFQVMPYNLSLAKGNTKITIKIGAITTLIFIPLVFILTKYYGMKGAATAWLISSSIMTPIYITTVLKKLTNFSILQWLFKYLLQPFALIIIGNALFYFIKPHFFSTLILNLIYITISSFLVLIISFIISFKVKVKDIPKFIQHELFA